MFHRLLCYVRCEIIKFVKPLNFDVEFRHLIFFLAKLEDQNCSLTCLGIDLFRLKFPSQPLLNWVIKKWGVFSFFLFFSPFFVCGSPQNILLRRPQAVSCGVVVFSKHVAFLGSLPTEFYFTRQDLISNTSHGLRNLPRSLPLTCTFVNKVPFIDS